MESVDRKFKLVSEEHCHEAMRWMLKAVESGKLHEVELRPARELRTLGANARYWATLTEYLNQIRAAIMALCDHTGHTPMEIRRSIAQTMPIEYGVLLFVDDPEPAHGVLKKIYGVPTSTRMTKKNFQTFHDRMEATMSEVLGTVNAYGAKL